MRPELHVAGQLQLLQHRQQLRHKVDQGCQAAVAGRPLLGQHEQAVLPHAPGDRAQAVATWGGAHSTGRREAVGQLGG